MPLSPRAQIFASIELFDELPPSELEHLARAAVARRYQVREALFSEGAPCEGIWIIAAGAVKILKTTPGGRMVMLAAQQAPATVAEVPVFDGSAYPATVVAAGDVEALLVPRQEFLAVCRRNPAVALAFLAVFGARLRQLIGLVERITFGSVRQRLASLLLDLAGESGAPEFTLAESHEELAARLGTVREVVTRNLARFQAEGLIRLERRRVTIADPAGLEGEAATEF